MANIKFSQLPTTTSLTGATIPVVQGGTNYIAPASLFVAPSSSGNIYAGNVSVTGNIQSSYVLGNGRFLTGMPELYSNANVQSYLPTYSGNIANLTVTGTLAGPTITDITSSTTGLTTNVTSLQGQVTSLTGGVYTNANAASYLTTATGNISAGNISASGNITSAILKTSGVVGGNITGVNLANANSYIAQVSFTTTGNVYGGNILSNNYFYANGAPFSGGGSSNYSNANVAAYLPVYSGNIAAGNISVTGNIVTGNISLTGNVYGNGSQLTGVLVASISAANSNVLIAQTTSGYQGISDIVFNRANVFSGIISSNTVALGSNVSFNGTGGLAVIIGSGAGGNTGAVSIGYEAGSNAGAVSFAVNQVSVGCYAGQYSQGSQTVALGYQAGQYSQGAYAVAIGGDNTGQFSQGPNAVAVGSSAGLANQGTQAVAVGNGAGLDTQGAQSIAIGSGAGYEKQRASAIALGYAAGYSNQGNNSIAIGTYAGYSALANNSIVISTSSLNGTTANALYVNPIRSTSGQTLSVYYDSSTKEITYGEAYSNATVQSYLPTYTGSLPNLAGNITTTANIQGSYVLGNGAFLTGLPAQYSNANVAAYLPTDSTIISIQTNISNTNSNVATLQTEVASLTGNVYNNANVAAYLPTYTGNLLANIISTTGNVVLPSNGRLLGDFSNSTIPNRSLFQTNQTNNYTSMGIIPGAGFAGFGTRAGMSMFNNSDAGNSAYIQIRSNGSNEASVATNATGTGVAGNLSLIAGSSTQVVLGTNGNITANANISTTGLIQSSNLSVSGTIVASAVVGDTTTNLVAAGYTQVYYNPATGQFAYSTGA